MPPQILLTSFTSWLPHQKSNASDDLLEKISHLNSPNSLTFLRQLPVDFEKAPRKAIATLNQVRPDVLICCGMAESRDKLTVESQANNSYEIIKTKVDIDGILADLAATEISHNAGRFVCEGLYYQMLKYISDRHLSTKCLFVHVPLLTTQNSPQIEADFLSILQKIKNC